MKTRKEDIFVLECAWPTTGFAKPAMVFVNLIPQSNQNKNRNRILQYAFVGGRNAKANISEGWEIWANIFVYGHSSLGVKDWERERTNKSETKARYV